VRDVAQVAGLIPPQSLIAQQAGQQYEGYGFAHDGFPWRERSQRRIEVATQLALQAVRRERAIVTVICYLKPRIWNV
jgi:hypothetical protein